MAGERHKQGFYERYVKRPQDFLCAAAAILILSPVILTVAVCVRIRLGSPVLFKQKRPGLNEKIFSLCKFRTMTDKRNEKGELLPDEERLTGFGKMLRSTSLDELPELFNILKGDMSVVGPRPLRVEYLPRYSKVQRRRHQVRPGLTGYAQVNGRNATSWEERLSQDVWYVGHVTFCGDVKIIFKTIPAVLKQQGIRSQTCATMEEFTGYKGEE